MKQAHLFSMRKDVVFKNSFCGMKQAHGLAIHDDFDDTSLGFSRPRVIACTSKCLDTHNANSQRFFYRAIFSL